jgi:primosomal protein N' (replication factor Y)
MSVSRQLVRIAVPVPLADAFDYLPPAGGSFPQIGCRVRVPFGRGERIGIVVDHPATSDVAPARLKAIGTVLDPSPVIGGELLSSLKWAAEYYHHPLGAVLSHALPGLLREGRAIDEPPEAAWQLTELGRAQDVARMLRSARRSTRCASAHSLRASSKRWTSRLQRSRGSRQRAGSRLRRRRNAPSTRRPDGHRPLCPSSRPINAACSPRSAQRSTRRKASVRTCCTASPVAARRRSTCG